MFLQLLPRAAPLPSPAAGSGRRRRFGVLLICCTSLFIVGLDVTVVNVALPAIGQDLHADVAGLQWTLGAYTVVMAGLLMLSGSTADRFGRRRTFVTGLGVFTAASLLCSVAPSVGLLVAFRALQAVGASMMNPVAMSIITNTFTDPRERAQAVGVWGAVFGVAMALGPIVGGALVASAGWRSIFWINLPLGLVAITLTLRFVPESRALRPRRFDPLGQVLVVLLLTSVTYGIIEVPRRGWSSAGSLATFAASVAGLLALVAYETRRDEPLLDPRFFRSVPFAASIAISVAAFAAFGGFLFLNTLYLQEVRGLSPLHAGLATVPMAAMTVVASTLSGRMVGRRGPRLPLLVAGAGSMAACALLAGVDAGTPFARLLAAYVVFGIGFGFVNAPITTAAVSGMPRAQAGVAAAVATTSRQFGQTLGVAVVGAIVASGAGGSVHAGLAPASLPAWWTLTGCGAVVLVLGHVATTRRAGASARRTAAALNPEAIAH
ncbi:MFS transporter [Baekduia soli]|uniref:MFS transporter n=1 Tax=Baekduia soli TaxID=496014 RepID=A0A5B8U966_9ACTN|nr:MFS transporter [Baekduia soli]QEC49545.1 MFS transporter [Baekduia soli]